MSCQSQTKHEDVQYKFCPDCGQKLEHFDIDKFNKDINEYADRYRTYADELGKITGNYCFLNRTQFYSHYIRENNIKQELYLYNDKFHTKKQMMDELGFQDEKYLSDLHMYNYGDSFYKLDSKLDANIVKDVIDRVNRRDELGGKYQKIVADFDDDSKIACGYIFNSVVSNRTIENTADIKKFLAAFSEAI